MTPPMVRDRLPERRANASVDLSFEGKMLTVCVGFDMTGRPQEVFASGHKAGSTMQRLLDDACVLISVALQHRLPVGALAKSLGRMPSWRGDQQVEGPASPIGVIVGVIGGFQAGDAD